MFFNSRNKGNIIKVNDNGVVTYYSLNVDRRVVLNNGSNILCIKDGYVYMYDADCRDKICIKQGKINVAGGSIVCLPNKISITVCGGDLDAVSWEE